MMGRSRPLALAGALLLLGGCGAFGDIQTLWGGESRAEKAERQTAEAAVAAQVPVAVVNRLEVGRTRNGFLITAYGTAPGLGYSLPTLRPRREGRPGLDGYIEYDFVATEPPPGFDLPPGTARTRALRADLPVSADDLRPAAGIRVLALRGGAQLDFAPSPPPTAAAGQQPGQQP
jgi:hypothetical protein